ncbi:acyl-CoA dehydrogenase family protein [Streptomyces sp. NPDC092296]|uniref:acyl-CoA dehydrogenase family protein n=1 Tax=Streptomyces sp. NPDC092296 TaxID=3366012 RepID=UPI0037FABF9F
MNGAAAELRRYRELGREGGLAAGLGAVLAGLDVAGVAPGGVAVLPTAVLAGQVGAGQVEAGQVEAGQVEAGQVEVLPHPFAGLEGLSLVRFAARSAGAGTGAGLTGRYAAALAAVRIGVLSRMVDAAVARLEARRFGGLPLIERQLVGGALADVVTEIEVAAAAAAHGDMPAEAAWAQHERLTEAGWATTRLFGAEGYLIDHPVRSLHLSALTADLWLPRPSATEGVR